MLTAKAAAVRAREICDLAPIVPVLVVDDVAHAVPLAEALVETYQHPQYSRIALEF